MLMVLMSLLFNVFPSMFSHCFCLLLVFCVLGQAWWENRTYSTEAKQEGYRVRSVMVKVLRDPWRSLEILRGLWGSLEIWGFPCGSAGKESACSAGDLRSIPGLGKFPGEGNSYPLQYSGLENSIDCVVHEVTKSCTQLSYFHFHFLGDPVEHSWTQWKNQRAGKYLAKAPTQIKSYNLVLKCLNPM